ncbi:MAG: T9SS type A sorting domain-containing protein, partial [Candidatus Zixiibacteriota bacterium]
CAFLSSGPRAINPSSTIELGVDFDGRTTTLWLSSEQELRGLQLVLATESQTPEKTIADGLDIYYGRSKSHLHLGIFDSDGPVTIPTGISPILEFEGRVDVVEAVVSDLNHRSWTPRVVSAANSNLPKQYSLAQNYPNPFNPTTEVRFSLPQAADVRLQVFNVAGRLVATLVDGKLSAGHHTATWHASEAASGVYFYRLQAGDYVASRKMMLLK